MFSGGYRSGANQLIDFYMRATLAFNVLNTSQLKKNISPFLVTPELTIG